MRSRISPSGPLRAAVVGVGAMGQAHCRTISEQVPEMRLAAVVDAHAETSREVAARYGVPSFASVAQLVEAGVVDAAVVATPHPLHLAAVEPCLQAGLHVLCEKPLAETISAADRMVDCARESGCVLAVMFQRRYEPVFEAALRFVGEGGLGELRRSLAVLPDFRTQCYYEANPWRATWVGEGGGVLVNQAPHLLDLFILLGGMPVSVEGHTTTALHAIEVEDRADARLVYGNGAVGQLYASTNEPCEHELIELVGTRGSLTYRNQQLQCQRFDVDLRDLSEHSREVWAKPAIQAATPSYEMTPENRLQGVLMGNFARHILRGEPLRCDAESAKLSLELANAIMLSSHLGASVALPVSRDAYDALLAQRRQASVPRKQVRATERVTDPKLI